MKFKSIFTGLAVFAAAMVFQGCSNDPVMSEPVYNSPAVQSMTPSLAAVTGQTPGTKVTLKGVVLYNVSRVLIGGFESPIVSQSFKELVFTIPAGNFPAGEVTLTRIEISDNESPEGKIIYQADCYIKVP